jgi:NTE family protein
MDAHVKSHATQAKSRAHSFEVVALVLQGGGALGAFQAGVYEALSEHGLHPNWIAGVSIGAINAAIIAGNSENTRVDRLQEFWKRVTAETPWSWLDGASFGFTKGDQPRNFLNKFSATQALAGGAAGFFAARPINPWLHPDGTIEATSFYNTNELKATLDFDRINAGATRFSVGAVNVRTGNFVYFDNTTHTIRPEHIMASGALPPAFRQSKSKANIIGTEASSRTRRCNGYSTPSRAATPWRFRSTYGARAASSPAICLKS